MTSHHFNLKLARISRLSRFAANSSCHTSANHAKNKADELKASIMTTLPSDVTAYWSGPALLVHGRGRTWIGKATDDLLLKSLPA
jgi:hypothetical protein